MTDRLEISVSAIEPGKFGRCHSLNCGRASTHVIRRKSIYANRQLPVCTIDNHCSVCLPTALRDLVSEYAEDVLLHLVQRGAECAS